MEMLCVLAVIIILAAATLPSISSFYGNSRQKAGVDLFRARLADARALAMETGTNYRIAISEDGTKIRVAPDGQDFATAPAATQPSFGAKVMESEFDKKVTAEVWADADDPPPLIDQGWVTVATFLTDGTCKEDTVVVRVKEGDFPPMRVLVRGVTGGSRTLPASSTLGGGP